MEIKENTKEMSMMWKDCPKDKGPCSIPMVAFIPANGEKGNGMELARPSFAIKMSFKACIIKINDMATEPTSGRMDVCMLASFVWINDKDMASIAGQMGRITMEIFTRD